MYWGIVGSFHAKTVTNSSTDVFTTSFARLGATSWCRTGLPIHRLPLPLHLRRGKSSAFDHGFTTHFCRGASRVGFLERILDERRRLLVSTSA